MAENDARLRAGSAAQLFSSNSKGMYRRAGSSDESPNLDQNLANAMMSSSSSKIPTTTTMKPGTVPHPVDVDPPKQDDFYWNFDQESTHLQGQEATLGMLESQSLQQPSKICE